MRNVLSKPREKEQAGRSSHPLPTPAPRLRCRWLTPLDTCQVRKPRGGIGGVSTRCGGGSGSRPGAATTGSRNTHRHTPCGRAAERYSRPSQPSACSCSPARWKAGHCSLVGCAVGSSSALSVAGSSGPQPHAGLRDSATALGASCAAARPRARRASDTTPPTPCSPRRPRRCPRSPCRAASVRRRGPAGDRAGRARGRVTQPACQTPARLRPAQRSTSFRRRSVPRAPRQSARARHIHRRRARRSACGDPARQAGD